MKLKEIIDNADLEAVYQSIHNSINRFAKNPSKIEDTRSEFGALLVGSMIQSRPPDAYDLVFSRTKGAEFETDEILVRSKDGKDIQPLCVDIHRFLDLSNFEVVIESDIEGPILIEDILAAYLLNISFFQKGEV